MLFARLDETTAGVRAALKQMGLDAEASLPIRKEVALLVSVWESAKSQRSFQVKQKLDASASGQARLVQTTEYAAMRAAVEKMQGRLRDKEAPSKSLVASKLEQLEDGAPVPEDLREATSLAQVVLLVLRAKEEQLVPGQFVVAMAQLCDNQGTVAASPKMLSLKQPLGYILQALGFFSLQVWNSAAYISCGWRSQRVGSSSAEVLCQMVFAADRSAPLICWIS